MGVWELFLVLWLSWTLTGAAQRAPANSFYYRCNNTRIGLAVKRDPLETGLELNPANLYLGHCHPSSTTTLPGYFVFDYGLMDCGFSRLIYGNTMKYSIDLVYQPSDGSFRQFSQPFREELNCTFTGLPLLPPSPIQVAGDLSGESKLEFSAQIMKDDFSGPSKTNVFMLGSPISVELSVVDTLHLPLQIYVDECTVAPTPVLSTSSQTYRLISNHGCFVDGKEADSKFHKRVSPGSLRLSFQALTFIGLGRDIFLHFKVVVWDPIDFVDPSRKACSYLLHYGRWELLDDPSRSSLCDCCESVCQSLSSRRKRSTNGKEEELGLLHTIVLGPLRVQRPPESGNREWDQNKSKAVMTKPGFLIPPAVGALFLEVAVLLVLAVGVALYSRMERRNGKETEATCLVGPES